MLSPPVPKKPKASVAAEARPRGRTKRSDAIFAPRRASVNAPSVRPLVGSFPRAVWNAASRYGGAR